MPDWSLCTRVGTARCANRVPGPDCPHCSQIARPQGAQSVTCPQCGAIEQKGCTAADCPVMLQYAGLGPKVSAEPISATSSPETA